MNNKELKDEEKLKMLGDLIATIPGFYKEGCEDGGLIYAKNRVTRRFISGDDLNRFLCYLLALEKASERLGYDASALFNMPA